jgi:hypothetical protein
VGHLPIGKCDKNTKLKSENLKKRQEFVEYMPGYSTKVCVTGLCVRIWMEFNRLRRCSGDKDI